MITEKTLKEESSHKNYYDDNYRAPFAMLIPVKLKKLTLNEKKVKK